MTRSAIEHILCSVGLDETDAALFLAGLPIGSAPASFYARAAALNRITAYNHLEALVKRGLFTAGRRKNGKHYQPISPEELSVEAHKNAEALERVLPELRSLQSVSHRRPHVRFYEGIEGIRRVYEDTLTAESEILNFANSQIVRMFWKEYDEEYVARRVAKGISLRGIAPNDEAGRAVQGHDRENLREIRLVSDREFNFNNEINIYDSRVGIVSFGVAEGELFGVIIESREVAETQRQIFEMAWRYAALARHFSEAELREPRSIGKQKTKTEDEQLLLFSTTLARARSTRK